MRAFDSGRLAQRLERCIHIAEARSSNLLPPIFHVKHIMPSSKRKFGDIGEKIAKRYLARKGYKVIGQNYWKPWGEIDIIAKKGKLLVFCEVKTRDAKHVEHYLAEASINRLKIRKLQKICETYLAEKKCAYNQEWQIDVLAISIDKGRRKAKIKHYKNAIWEKVY